jgi:hypothetical protein
MPCAVVTSTTFNLIMMVPLARFLLLRVADATNLRVALRLVIELKKVGQSLLLERRR